MNEFRLESPFPKEGLSKYYEWSKASWHLAWPPMTERQFIDYMIPRITQGPSWGIYEDNKLIGGQITELMSMEGQDKPTSFTFHIALAPEARGKKIYQQIGLKCVEHVFNEYPSTLRCTAWLVECNAPVRKIVEDIGFKQEGIMRDGVIIKGKVSNLVLYGLIRGDLNYGRIL